jgi:two-component system response regulator
MDTRPILLVEDNPDDVALTLRAFRKNRIVNDVVVARDGVEALDYLFATGTYSERDPAESPAVVLLDLNLPRLDGVEVLRRLRADRRTQLLRVVVLTSSKEEPDVVRSYTHGANSYIRKPVDFDSFMSAVGQLGLYWLLLNETPPPSDNRPPAAGSKEQIPS